MAAFYNEFDPFAAAWLRELIKAGLIPDGEVDERSISDIKPKEIDGFTQHHFFAGCGGWPIALRLAGWPDDEPIITGSCPCEPFSCAGKGKGIEDDRHLWPAFRWVISQNRPQKVCGEQVAVGGLAWMQGVKNDLEAIGYTVEVYDIPACSVGAWHTRRRFFWMAYIDGTRWPRQRQTQSEKWNDYFISAWESSPPDANINGTGWQDAKRSTGQTEPDRREITMPGVFRERAHQWETEPDVVCVVHGLSSNSRAVSAYGRAIVPQAAAEFIKAFMLTQTAEVDHVGAKRIE